MRVEIRASGGPSCPECGAFPLIHTKGDGLALERDLIPLIEKWFESYAKPRRWWQRKPKLDLPALTRDVEKILIELRGETRRA